jgi:hypothetical protein
MKTIDFNQTEMICGGLCTGQGTMTGDAAKASDPAGRTNLGDVFRNA